LKTNHLATLLAKAIIIRLNEAVEGSKAKKIAPTGPSAIKAVVSMKGHGSN
jgi:hypothetical protein